MKHAVSKLLVLTLALSMLTITAMGAEEESPIPAVEADYAAVLADAERVEATSDPFDDELATKKLSQFSTKAQGQGFPEETSQESPLALNGITVYDVGDYQFTENESNDRYYQANILDDNSTVSASVYGYDLDWFVFTLPQRSLVMFLTVTDTTDLWFAIYDSTGEEIIAAGTTSEYRGDGIYGGSLVNELSAGTYYLRFLSADKSYIDYMFYFDHSAAYLNTPVTNLSLNANTGKPVLSWNSIPGAESYEIWRAVSNGGYQKIASGYGTSYTDSSAQPGQTYYYRVRAVSDYATSDYSAAKAVTVPAKDVVVPLDSPNISVKLNTSNKPVLTWNAVEGAAGYEILVSVNGGTYQRLITTTGTKLTHSSAKVGTEYSYRVRALGVTAETDSAYSNVVTVNTPALTPKLNVVANSKGKPYLTWSKISGAEKYYVYVSTSGKDGTFSRISITTGTALTHSSASYGKTYYYKVRAAHGSTLGNFSDVESVKCAIPVPELEVELNAKGKPYLTWSKVPGAEKYYVYVSTTGKTGTFSRISITTGNALTHSSAKENTTYYYKVRAIVGGVSGDLCDSEKITTANLTPTLTVTLNAKGKPVLEWEEVDTATTYYVYRSLSGVDGTFTRLSIVTGTKLTNSSAVAGTEYFYKIRAVNGSTLGNFGNTESIICE